MKKDPIKLIVAAIAGAYFLGRSAEKVASIIKR